MYTLLSPVLKKHDIMDYSEEKAKFQELLYYGRITNRPKQHGMSETIFQVFLYTQTILFSLLFQPKNDFIGCLPIRPVVRNVCLLHRLHKVFILRALPNVSLQYISSRGAIGSVVDRRNQN